MATPDCYSITVRLGNRRTMDLFHDGEGRKIHNRSDAVRELTRLVEDGFDRGQLEILPHYGGPLFVPVYSCNHTDSFS